MDNNLSERRLRGPALGRKNYYGSAALWSGRLAAGLFSILATLELWGLNPRLWLQWYLQNCAEAGGKVPEGIEPFLPWNLSSDRRAELSLTGAGQKPDTT
jgi:transposase